MEKNDIQIFEPGVADFENIAVAIRLTDPQNQQRHLGLLLKPDADKPVKLMHLAWHNKFLLEEDFEGKYYFLTTCNGLEETLIEIFVDWLLIVWEKNKDGLPYSLRFNVSENAFSTTGEVKKLELGEGFTCSTFVLECFKCQGYDLIDYSSWPARPEDKTWAERIFNYLEKTSNVDGKHIEAQKEPSVTARFRPEEVAAAANLNNFDGSTLSFSDVEPFSLEVVKKVS